MHLGEAIKEYRNNHGLSMQAFADKCGVSKGYIAMLERNVNSKTGEPVIPSVETFIKVSKAMNITLIELFEKVDENRPTDIIKAPDLPGLESFKKKLEDYSGITNLSFPAARPLPILGTICAGDGVFCEENYSGYFFVDNSIRADLCLTVRGDSMNGLGIQDGDIAFIRKTDTVTNGKVYAIRINSDSEAVLKSLYIDGDKAILNSANPDYAPIITTTDNISVIGALVGTYHSLK